MVRVHFVFLHRLSFLGGPQDKYPIVLIWPNNVKCIYEKEKKTEKQERKKWKTSESAKAIGGGYSASCNHHLRATTFGSSQSIYIVFRLWARFFFLPFSYMPEKSRWFLQSIMVVDVTATELWKHNETLSVIEQNCLVKFIVTTTDSKPVSEARTQQRLNIAERTAKWVLIKT